jgi:hypothetical protein
LQGLPSLPEPRGLLCGPDGLRMSGLRLPGRVRCVLGRRNRAGVLCHHLGRTRINTKATAAATGRRR